MVAEAVEEAAAVEAAEEEEDGEDVAEGGRIGKTPFRKSRLTLGAIDLKVEE